VDGGDVLCIGRKVFIGLSSRSNIQAIQQMQAILSPYGYTVQGINISGFLHLKSAVTQIAVDTLLVNPAWVDASIFGNFQVIDVDPHEPYGANALWIDEGVIYPANFSRTQQRIEKTLEKINIQLFRVDVSELQKAEGAVTCCSLIIRS
jgi:dimethylargininase